MHDRILSNNMKLALGSSKPETAMSGVSAYPASGSYIDVTGYEYVHILAHLGTLHTSDTPTLTPKCADTASGTLHTIDSSLVHTPDVDGDDGEWVTWTIKVDTLPVDHHFVTLATGGTLHTIDSSLVHTPDVDGDDGEWVTWTIKVDTLPVDHHFVTLATGGTLTNGSYIDVLFLLDGARSVPVTQTTAVLPTASQYNWVS